MKKLQVFLISFSIIGFFACTKKENTTLDLKNISYSDKTPVQMKADMENTGVQMVDQMKGLNTEPGMEATVNLAVLLDSSGMSPNAKSATLSKLAALKRSNESNNIQPIMAALRQTTDNNWLIKIYDKIAATYTYNFTTGQFDSTPSNTFIIKFPASKTAKQNKQLNGAFTIYIPTTQTVNLKIGDTTITDLPSSIKFDIKIDNTAVLTYEFTASYNSDGMPNSVVSSLTIGPYNFLTKWTYLVSDVSLNYSITNNSKTIIDLGWELKGNFDRSTINKLDTAKNPDPTILLTNANAHFQFMDVEIAGLIDFKDLYDTMKLINNDSTLVKTTSIVNKDVVLVVAYVSTGKVIAKAEAYPKITQYKESYWDWQTGQTIQVTYTKTEMDMRMVFKDGSKSDLQTYFSTGFTNVINDFNTFIDELNTTYGWKINHVQN